MTFQIGVGGKVYENTEMVQELRIGAAIEIRDEQGDESSSLLQGES